MERWSGAEEGGAVLHLSWQDHAAFWKEKTAAEGQVQLTWAAAERAVPTVAGPHQSLFGRSLLSFATATDGTPGPESGRRGSQGNL